MGRAGHRAAERAYVHVTGGRSRSIHGSTAR